MEAPENFIAYDPEQLRYTLVGSNGHVSTWLTAGDILALSIGGQDQQARVASGGYRSWYFVTANGHRGRFAISMKARLLTHTPARKQTLPHTTSFVHT